MRNLLTYFAISLLTSAVALPQESSEKSSSKKDEPPKPVAVKYHYGLLHGFVILRDEKGEIIAAGDLAQTPKGDQIVNKLSFKFRDGSTYEDTAIFTQRRTFRLISDHLVQKGPAFKRPLDLTVDCQSGFVTVISADDDGKPKNTQQRMKLPVDIANGITPMLLTNAPPESGGELKLSMIVATPKPRIVKLAITAAGEDSFTHAGTPRKAAHYVAKIDLGGVAGVVAPIVGKQPADTHLWLATGDAPQVVRSRGPMFEGGPIWTLDIAAPSWP
jgi:hypothetical protein